MQTPINVLLGITGGIAAYKSAEIARLLIKRGCHVKAVMTHGAQQFIGPLTLQALTGKVVHQALLDEASEAAMGHIDLARWADHILIAPATAHVIAKLAHGWADDLLTTLCLATKAPITVAPAMNQAMWANRATQDNISKLHERGAIILGPDNGEQACGETGPGRLMAPETLVDKFVGNIMSKPDLVSPPPSSRHLSFDNQHSHTPQRHWVITAGPTREAIDPVRYITNRSSGKMGFAVAAAAAARGQNVTLIAGPTALDTPQGVQQRIDVNSCQEMLAACKRSITPNTAVFLSAAAVSDYRCETIVSEKIKKDGETLSLKLIKNPDIIQAISQCKQHRPQVVVGFAAETHMVKEHAKDKLIRKGLDLIIANDVSQSDIGFDSDYNQIQVISKNNCFSLGPTSKISLGQQLVNIILELVPKPGS
jgi:phosphopantothenoylcysteine decarboxylase/phosphopantothenate--cysteine ligase